MGKWNNGIMDVLSMPERAAEANPRS